MSEWTNFALKHYHEQKKHNPNYKYKDALKDASPLFKKSNSTEKPVANKTVQSRRKKSKTPGKKNKTSGKRKTQSKR